MTFKIVLATLCTMILCGCPGKSPNQASTVINCMVTTVTDGDTIGCTTTEKKTYIVRLANIDAPEKKQDYGAAAKKHLSDLIYMREVTIKISGQDKYERYLGEVFLGNLNVNKDMVSSGHAWAYREYLKDDQYIALEDSAKSQKFGFWIAPNPLNPKAFRKSLPN